MATICKYACSSQPWHVQVPSAVVLTAPDVLLLWRYHSRMPVSPAAHALSIVLIPLANSTNTTCCAHTLQHHNPTNAQSVFLLNPAKAQFPFPLCHEHTLHKSQMSLSWIVKMNVLYQASLPFRFHTCLIEQQATEHPKLAKICLHRTNQHAETFKKQVQVCCCNAHNTRHTTRRSTAHSKLECPWQGSNDSSCSYTLSHHSASDLPELVPSARRNMQKHADEQLHHR
jgi:hypothetical protein